MTLLSTLRLFGFATLFGIAMAMVFGLGAVHAADGATEGTNARTSLADTLMGPRPAMGRIALKSSVSVDAPLVRLSDLATGTLRNGDTPLFRAPKPGTTGSVSVGRVIEAVRKLGYEQISTGGITAVSVTRTGRNISREAISAAIADHLIFLGHAQKGTIIDIRLDPGVTDFFVEQAATGSVRVVKLDASPAARRFSAMVTVEDSTIIGQGIRVSGFAEELIEVPTLARPINRGEVISPSDVTLTPMPLSQIGQSTMMRIEQLAGMAARRALRADHPVTGSDLMRPLLIRKDDMVSIVYRHSGLTLTVRGRAVSQGAEGDMVTVLNLQSNRMLRGTVGSDGSVIVAPAAGKLTKLSQS